VDSQQPEQKGRSERRVGKELWDARQFMANCELFKDTGKEDLENLMAKGGVRERETLLKDHRRTVFR